MDYDEEEGCGIRNIFRSFVCVALTLLLGLHVYSYLWGSQDTIEGDFGDIKYMVMQLTQGLSEMNREHERIRNELERMSSALPAMTAASGRVKDALEPTRRHARQLMDMGDYDRQIADYALESAGARILDTGETQEYVIYESSVGWALHVVSSVLCRECPGASAILRPGTLPGECWAFRGSRGEVTIRLVGSVHVTGMSIEHIPAHISPTKEISSAPRLFQLEGLSHRGDPHPHDFGSFEYDKDGKPIQYFEVQHPASAAYLVVRLKVFSNWGHSLYTCLYRVRIHGELAPGQAPQKTITDEETMNLH
ncbi:SUN domain-containing protein 3 [Papilio machaon]|uniref:SUN domain-containing protein 3 n=1 Tax=Papilio machaon TaxID=76193 RepID=A0A194RHD8_PAPMA|nr:SUN domain-containing protein 3 [Papilio machaon]